MRNAISWTLAAVAVAFAAQPSAASDGRLEINQTSALAGGVTPGDAPGFPVTLSRSGSYVVTGSLLVPDANTTAILVEVDDVSIDLNGFEIAGPITCSSGGIGGPPSGASLTCSGSGSGVGIQVAAGHSGTAVHDGRVHGFGSHGLDIQVDCMVRRLTSDQNAGSGIKAVGRCLMRELVIESNGRAGIEIGSYTDPGSGRSSIAESVVRANAGNGVIGVGLSFVHSTTVRNGANGVNSLQGGLVTNTNASANGLAGIVVVEGYVAENTVEVNDNVGMNIPGSGFVRNVMWANDLGSIASGVSLAFNICDGVFSC